ncbi:MAG: peptidoglycan DD-metalloendopeptidase family protein, partial [Pseudomonadota bacterium]|nr:peptidoglycan DD-metalloendopeptidase family protein [Pseudomonadota bacterium]
YTVKKGDTLLHIALEFGQNYRDLVVWNQLTNPNDIRVDQVLRVLPPNGAAQTGSVAASSGVEVRPLNSPAPAPASSSVAVKTGPRGDKRPYSDAALAELQKAESSTPSAAVARSETPKSNDKAADKVGDKAGEKAAPEPSVADENIGFIWPAEGKVVGSFEDGKKGIDIAGKSGQAVQAAAAGKVMYAGSGIRGYGNLVIVKHSNSLLSAYAHNKSILVKEGQNVSKGEKIAEMGNSDADSVKLHFEIRQQGKPVDPSKFLPAK